MAKKTQPSPPARPMPRIGLALGGGGAKGLAHVLVFEVFEELGLKPHMLSGASIGAVMAALYAAGASATQIKHDLNRVFSDGAATLGEALLRREALRFLELLDPNFGRGGFLKGERLLALVAQTMGATTFEELEIPLKLVASDFWAREEVVLDSGELLPAIRASMALPSLFTPVVVDGRVLIDGGAANPVPYDLLTEHCDLVVAVDVLGSRQPPQNRLPTVSEAVFNSYQIMQRSILRQKLKYSPPDIYLDVDISEVRTLEFYKTSEIYRQAQPAKDDLKRRLAVAIADWPGRTPRQA